MIIQKDGIFRNIAPESWQTYHEKGYEQVSDAQEKKKMTAANKESKTKATQETF